MLRSRQNCDASAQIYLFSKETAPDYKAIKLVKSIFSRSHEFILSRTCFCICIQGNLLYFSDPRIFTSRIRESNPPPQLGKLIYYRCTNPAFHERYLYIDLSVRQKKFSLPKILYSKRKNIASNMKDFYPVYCIRNFTNNKAAAFSAFLYIGLFFSLNFPTSPFISCDWLDSSSLAAALSSAVAEFVCTTLEIWSIPTII